MLKQNATIFAQYPVRRFGGLFCQEHSLFGRTDKRNWFASQNLSRDQKSGHTTGTLPPGTALMPQKSGGMASRSQINGTGLATSSITGGVNGEATITGTGDITSAVAQLVISMVATITGETSLSSADLRGYLNAVASLSGGGDINASVAALAWASAALSSEGSITNAQPYATGTLEATIRGYSDLTPEGIRDKVWAAVIDAGYSADQILKLLAAQAAGNGTNLEGSNPTFKNLDGTITRISGTYSAGTRTINSIDVT